MYNVVLVRYGEIGLKGRNRPVFEALLARAVRRALHQVPGAGVEREYGRLIVTLPGAEAAEDVVDRLRSVFGIVSVSPALRLPLDMEPILSGCEALVAQALARAQRPVTTFKIAARRSNKAFPLRTPEINAALGAHVLRSFPGRLSVDVRSPDLTVHAEIRERFAYLYTEIYEGLGGLPVGSSSRALLLLSGGIDSPVAGWLALKRGIFVEAVHFHSPPYTSERSLEKVIDLAEVLSRYAGDKVPVHVVAFTKVQEAIREVAPPPMRITLMRRMMLRIADGLARQRGIPALVTGESVAQVASQTLESMHVINAVTTMPILRPLVAMDKAEIIALAERIGTFEISVRPYEDCCTLFVPERPETKPRLDRVERVEERLPVAELVEEAIAGTRRHEPGAAPPWNIDLAPARLFDSNGR